MLAPAQRYLMIRSLGAPAVLLSLAMQGVFRGFKDTKTPLYATGIEPSLFLALFSFCVFLVLSSVVPLCFNSCRRSHEHNLGPYFHICVPLGCLWCSHCACTFTVSFTMS